MSLTRGALARICAGEEVPQPHMQVLGYKKIAGSGQERYRILLSDGKYYNSFSMLATQLNPMIHNNELEQFTIIRVDKYICNQVQGQSKRVVILLEVSVVKPGEQVGEKIGNPAAMGGDGSAKVQNQNANPNVGGGAVKRPNEQQPPPSHEAKKPMVNDQPRPANTLCKEERMKRGNVQKEQDKASQEESTGIVIEKIENINKKIEDSKQRWEEVLEKQKLEREKLVRKHQEEKTHQEETFTREAGANKQHMADLTELRNELVQDLVKIHSDKGKSNDKLKAARRALECPICLESMKPPKKIWMCPLSHAICEACKILLEGKPCPTCTSGRVNLRAYTTEKLAEIVFDQSEV